MKNYTFHVKGMHCKSCVILTETELTIHPGVHTVKADLSQNVVEVFGDFGEKELSEILQELSPLIEKHGYSLHAQRPEQGSKWADFAIAFPIAMTFLITFIILQKLGIVNLVNASDVTFGTAFVVGIIASLSTCMAIVGGLVLSISANFAKEGEKFRPQLLFHVGRIVSFFLLGGAIGALGSALQIGPNGTFILSIVVAIVMLLLGINLLDLFPWARKLTPTLPRFFSKHLLQIKEINHVLTPLFVGVLTFFLPCGFTQSMQLFALSTGNFWSGAMTMFSFALGTFPVLALLSFTSVAIHDKVKSKVFFRTAGLIVVFFALFNLINSLVAKGILPPIFNF